MDNTEYSILQSLYEGAERRIRKHDHITAYIRTEPEVAFERLQQRGRLEEKSIPLSYIKTIHDKHEDWLVHRKNELPEIVVELDGNGDFTCVKNEYAKLFCVIAEYLHEISK
jgi:deoxyadenosine/deoxycytidine kinase